MIRDFSNIGFIKTIKVSSRLFAFIQGGGYQPAFVIQIWTKGSKVIFYQGSHQIALPVSEGSMGVLETDPIITRTKNIKAITIELKEGG